MDPINGEAVGFQQTQNNTRVKDPGPATNANPPPPPKPVVTPTPTGEAPSPFALRGKTLNTLA